MLIKVTKISSHNNNLFLFTRQW